MEGLAEATPQKNVKTKVWVTDCISVSSMNKLFITTADRDMQVYDMSSQQFYQVYKLYGKMVLLFFYLQDLLKEIHQNWALVFPYGYWSSSKRK